MSTKKSGNLESESLNTGIAPEETIDIKNYTFQNKALGSKVMAFCGDDIELQEHFIKAIEYTNRYPGKGFTVAIKKFDDIGGQLIDVLSVIEDVPDKNKLPAGRYKIVLKYYDPRQPKKTAKGESITSRGAIKTVSRNIIIGDPYQADLTVKGSGDKGQIPSRESTPLPPQDTGITGISGVQGMTNQISMIYQELNTLIAENIKFQIDTMKMRNELENQSYSKGIEVGKLQKELELTRSELDQVKKSLSERPESTESGENIIRDIIIPGIGEKRR